MQQRPIYGLILNDGRIKHAEFFNSDYYIKEAPFPRPDKTPITDMEGIMQLYSTPHFTRL